MHSECLYGFFKSADILTYRISKKLEDGSLSHNVSLFRNLRDDMDLLRVKGGLANLVRGMLIETSGKADNVFAEVVCKLHCKQI